MNYWLFKTEPEVFSLNDLKNARRATARWDEVRNYQARNFLRDGVELGDTVFIYHSQTRPTAIVGTAEVVESGYPDPSQFNPEHPYFDPKSRADSPRWYCVDLRHTQTFKTPVTLSCIKAKPELADMVLIRQGRLSVQPVSSQEAAIIFEMAK